MSYTAETYRQMADEALADSKAPRTRDNFLTLNAARVMAGRYSHCADTIEAGMRDRVTALFLNGELASADYREGSYGWYWLLNDAAAEVFGKRFFTGSSARNHLDRDRAKGFTYGTILADAYIDDSHMVHVDSQAVRAGNFEVVSSDDYIGRSSITSDVAA